MGVALKIPTEPLPRCVTVEEYLAFNEQTEVKTEYLNGRVYCQGVPIDPASITGEELRAMSGGKSIHSHVAGNIIGLLFIAIGDKPCNVHTSDMAVELSATGDYVFPDVTVSCGVEDLLTVRGIEILQNPLIIVEVLSPSTQNYDLNDKAAAYRQIASLQEILFVSPEWVWIEHHARQNTVSWIRSTYDDITQSLRLNSLNCDVALRNVYRNFGFE